MRPLFDEVRQVLLRKWDPIGIVSMGGPDDEYDTYVPGIVGLVQKPNVDPGAIADHLMQIEAEQMGLRPSRERAEVTARALLEVRQRVSPPPS